MLPNGSVRSTGAFTNKVTNTQVFATGELRTDVGGSGEVVIRYLDTSDLASIRTFAKEVLDSEKAIHVLVGAGVGRSERRRNWAGKVGGKGT